EALPEPVPEDAADQKAEAGASPHDADAGGSAVEDQFTEDAEQDLGGAAAGSPSHADQGDAENQRVRAHVPQAVGVLVPGANDIGFGQGGAFGAESIAGQEQARDAECGDDERQRVSDEGPFVAELHDAGAGQEGANGQRGPLSGLSQGIGGM